MTVREVLGFEINFKKQTSLGLNLMKMEGTEKGRVFHFVFEV